MIKRISNELRKFSAALEEKGYSVRRMILFGSHARGNALKQSDVDVIVVSPEFKHLSVPRRQMMLQELWPSMSLPLETLPYTPDEFERVRKTSYTVKEAIADGIDFTPSLDVLSSILTAKAQGQMTAVLMAARRRSKASSRRIGRQLRKI